MVVAYVGNVVLGAALVVLAATVVVVAAVVGGTDVFGLFLGIGYDAFYLTRTDASVPRGRPVFPGVGRDGVMPEDVMRKYDLVLKGTRVLDAATNTRVEEWGPAKA